MATFEVVASGNVMGTYEGATEQEAVLAQYRDAGYGPEAVWLDADGEIEWSPRFGDIAAACRDTTAREVSA